MLTLFFSSFVTAFHEGDAMPRILRNYRNPRWPQPDLDTMKVWESACATAATTTFFQRFEVNHDQTFVKAPLEWNNPVRRVYREAQDLWPDEQYILLSIGTGAAPEGETNLEAIFREAEKVATEFPSDHETMVYHHHLFRFNVIEGMDKISPTELRERAKLSETVDAYLNSPSVELVFQKCIESLKSEKSTQGTTSSYMSREDQMLTRTSQFTEATAYHDRHTHAALCADCHKGLSLAGLISHDMILYELIVV